MAKEPLADAFFGFPDVEEVDLDFVTDVLGFLENPALVVDKDLKIVTANLQGRDTLAWIRSIYPDPGPKDSLPRSLAGAVAPRVRKRVHDVVKDVAVIDDPPFLFDLFISKGRIGGDSYIFIVLMVASTGQKLRGVPALQRLLNGFRGNAFVGDRETKFVNINDSFLDLVGFSREELVGHHLNEFNTSEQAKAYGRVFQSLIDEPRVLRSPAVTYSTVRRGAFVSPMTAWTITDRYGDALGLAVVGGYSARPRPEADRIERRHVLLEKAADLMSEAIFITDLDGKILVMNTAAENFIPATAGREAFNIKTDIPWEIPETIEDVFRGMREGRDESILTTAVVKPAGNTVLKTRIFGLKRVTEEIQEVVFVCDDVTQEESLKQTLFQTTRRLADDRTLRDSILENVDIPFSVVDENLTILDLNEATASRFRTTKREMLGVKLTELNPNVEESGLGDLIRSTIEKNEMFRKPDFTHITRHGAGVSLDLTLIPVELGGRRVCISIAESEVATQAGDELADLRMKSAVSDAVVAGVTEGIFVVDRDGTFLEVNEGAALGSSIPREHVLGRNVRDLIAMSDDEDLFTALWERLLTANEPFRTGVVKSRSRVDGMEQFVDIIVNPIAGPGGSIEKYLVIVHYLKEIKSLEQQVADYTENLERMVAEKTRQLSESNVLLANTAERVARTARSGEILASLEDRESVIDSFLKHAREVTGADYLKIVLRDTSVLPPRIEQKSLGAEPAKDRSVSEVIEEAMSRMMLKSSAAGRVLKPLDSLIIAEFISGSESGLFISRKSEGRFTPIDVDLAHLLCAQLSFALPAASYVAEQRREREKAECLRRIAFRIAGIASVKEAVRAVAEEVSSIIAGDRFFWLVKEVGDLVWVTEIYNRDGPAPGASHHVELGGAGGESGDLFSVDRAGDISCERLRRTGGEVSAECRFVAGANKSGALGMICSELNERGILKDDGGSCAIVPVRLTEHSPSYICAHSSRPDAFPDDDICFMCLAASAVGRVWLEADAASSIRRLREAGETMSELAHDFKYPMGRIADLLRRIASGEIDAAESRDSAGPLLADVEHLSALSNEFIDLARPAGDKPEFIDLVQMLENSLALAADDLARKSVRVERDFDDRPLPPVLASRSDVSRVLINLIANSHDAVDEGGWIRVRAFLDDCEEEPRVTLTFQNSGPPVSPAVREDLFNPFKSTKEGGTGLGLFSARRRANANAGDVVFEVDQSGREQFAVWFPAAFE